LYQGVGSRARLSGVELWMSHQTQTPTEVDHTKQVFY
jgi:hypothetical protein